MLKKVIEECLHMYYGSNNLMLAGIVKMRFEFFFFVCARGRECEVLCILNFFSFLFPF